MTSEEQLNALADTLCFGTVSAEQRRAAHLLIPLWRRQRDCLRWVSGQVVGRRGGIPACDLQAIAAAGARGEDWQAVRDARATKRAASASRGPKLSSEVDRK